MQKKYQNLVFVDCEARGPSPLKGILTEYGAVHYLTRKTFHGRLYEAVPDPENPAVPKLTGKRIADDREVAQQFMDWLDEVNQGRRVVMVSDNPAYDFMWIAVHFDAAGLDNPFGHSARRISDFWAGLQVRWSDTQSWKRFRKTRHDHNPVNDAMGNVEAFEHILELMNAQRDGRSPGPGLLPLGLEESPAG